MFQLIKNRLSENIRIKLSEIDFLNNLVSKLSIDISSKEIDTGKYYFKHAPGVYFKHSKLTENNIRVYDISFTTNLVITHSEKGKVGISKPHEVIGGEATEVKITWDGKNKSSVEIEPLELCNLNLNG